MDLSTLEPLWIEIVASRAATQEQCRAAVARQLDEGGSVVEQLVAAGVDPARLVLPLAAAFQIIPALGHQVRQPDLALCDVISPALANRLLLVPYELGADRALHAACADPTLLAGAPRDLPPFNLRVASLDDVRAGLDALMNVDPHSSTAPDMPSGSGPSAAFAQASTMLRGAASDLSEELSSEEATETQRRVLAKPARESELSEVPLPGDDMAEATRRPPRPGTLTDDDSRRG